MNKIYFKIVKTKNTNRLMYRFENMTDMIYMGGKRSKRWADRDESRLKNHFQLLWCNHELIEIRD